MFSTLIPETHHNVSAGFVDILIQTQREELFTGLMQLSYLANEKFVFAFVGGVEQKIYHYGDNATETISRLTWQKTVGRSEASVGLLNFSLEAMRVMQVIHEAPIIRSESLTLSSLELLTNTATWMRDSAPSIVHVQADQVERWYLLTDRSDSLPETIVFEDGKVNFASADSTFARNLPDSAYQVVRYVSAHEHDVWREYELRLAMNPYVKILMSRFNELAGRVLTQRLCEQLTLWARGGGWNIVLTSEGVIDREYFDVLDAAIHAYADILRRFYEEAGSAVGPRMAENLPRDVLFKMDATCRELLLQHLFTRHGSSGLLVRAE